MGYSSWREKPGLDFEGEGPLHRGRGTKPSGQQGLANEAPAS